MNDNETIIGTIRAGRHIGIKNTSYYKYCACPMCGKKRWIELRKGIPKNILCRTCSIKETSLTRMGDKSIRWTGGRYTNKQGYIFVYIPRDHRFNSSMAFNKTYIAEHRLVMAEHLNRPLTRKEIVHHKNGKKSDNRIENLELTALSKHSKDHYNGYEDGHKKGYRDGYAKGLEEARAALK